VGMTLRKDRYFHYGSHSDKYSRTNTDTFHEYSDPHLKLHQFVMAESIWGKELTFCHFQVSVLPEIKEENSLLV
jgi:hypothetical protein